MNRCTKSLISRTLVLLLFSAISGTVCRVQAQETPPDDIIQVIDHTTFNVKFGTEKSPLPAGIVVGIDVRKSLESNPDEMLRRYFWIRATAQAAEDSSQILSTLDLEIIPLTKMESYYYGSSGEWISLSSVRSFPTFIRRDLKLGNDFSATVFSSGYIYEGEIPIVSGEDLSKRVSAITFFAQAVVDYLGLNFTNLGTNGNFAGLALGHAGFDGGFAVGNLFGNEKLSIRLAFGFDETLIAGYGTKSSIAAILESRTFARIEMAIYGFVLYIEKCYRDLDLSGPLSGGDRTPFRLGFKVKF